MNAIQELMQLQGEIKVRLLLAGLPEAKAHEQAAEILHLFITSAAAEPTYKAAYRDLSA